MSSINYKYVIEDLHAANDGTSSDYRYVMRKMLVRGSSEAMYRSRINDGDKAFEYKRIMYGIEDVLENLDSMIDRDGNIQAHHRRDIIETLIDCSCLLGIDQAETNADYNKLKSYLSKDLFDSGREKSKAA